MIRVKKVPPFYIFLRSLFSVSLLFKFRKKLTQVPKKQFTPPLLSSVPTELSVGIRAGSHKNTGNPVEKKFLESMNAYEKLEEGYSTQRPPMFNGKFYTYWKNRMEIYIKQRTIKSGES